MINRVVIFEQHRWLLLYVSFQTVIKFLLCNTISLLQASEFRRD